MRQYKQKLNDNIKYLIPSELCMYSMQIRIKLEFSLTFLQFIGVNWIFSSIQWSEWPFIGLHITRGTRSRERTQNAKLHHCYHVWRLYDCRTFINSSYSQGNRSFRYERKTERLIIGLVRFKTACWALGENKKSIK